MHYFVLGQLATSSIRVKVSWLFLSVDLRLKKCGWDWPEITAHQVGTELSNFLLYQSLGKDVINIFPKNFSNIFPKDAINTFLRMSQISFLRMS